MDTDCILERRSIRTYTDESITDSQLETLLKAGMYAPSALNIQPWEFIVIKDPKALKELADICEYWGPVANAAIGIVVCGHISGPKNLEEFTVQDCSAATENILCAATGLRLGGVWLGCYGVPERMKKVSELLCVPDGVIPISVLAIGYPKTAHAGHTEFHTEKVHHGRY